MHMKGVFLCTITIRLILLFLIKGCGGFLDILSFSMLFRTQLIKLGSVVQMRFLLLFFNENLIKQQNDKMLISTFISWNVNLCLK